MRVGKLRHPVNIEKPTESQDDYGNTVNTWSTHAASYAAIDPIGSREYYHAEQAKSIVTHTIRTRFVPGVTNNMRIVYGSRVFNILRALPDSLGRTLTMKVTEIV